MNYGALPVGLEGGCRTADAKGQKPPLRAAVEIAVRSSVIGRKAEFFQTAISGGAFWSKHYFANFPPVVTLVTRASFGLH